MHLKIIIFNNYLTIYMQMQFFLFTEKCSSLVCFEHSTSGKIPVFNWREGVLPVINYTMSGIGATLKGMPWPKYGGPKGGDYNRPFC